MINVTNIAACSCTWVSICGIITDSINNKQNVNTSRNVSESAISGHIHAAMAVAHPLTAQERRGHYAVHLAYLSSSLGTKQLQGFMEQQQEVDLAVHCATRWLGIQEEKRRVTCLLNQEET